MTYQEGIYHQIIEKPWEYEIISFYYSINHTDLSSSYIDIIFKKDNTTRKLRFLSPNELIIEKGFPTPTSGLIILDVSNRQLENINVRVDDFEASQGAIKFWAHKVIDLENSETDLTQ
jgi:hypothetical protein